LVLLAWAYLHHKLLLIQGELGGVMRKLARLGIIIAALALPVTATAQPVSTPNGCAYAFGIMICWFA
jgi:hypothetical protein